MRTTSQQGCGDIVFDLIKDATTNAPEWEVTTEQRWYPPEELSGEFCPITLYLHDTETAPDFIPNYDMSTLTTSKARQCNTVHRVDSQVENVPDYFDDWSHHSTSTVCQTSCPRQWFQQL